MFEFHQRRELQTRFDGQIYYPFISTAGSFCRQIHWQASHPPASQEREPYLYAPPASATPSPCADPTAGSCCPKIHWQASRPLAPQERKPSPYALLASAHIQ